MFFYVIYYFKLLNFIFYVIYSKILKKPMKKQRFMTLAHDHVSGKKSSQEHTPPSLDHLKTLRPGGAQLVPAAAKSTTLAASE